jgi:hypothetical protein
MKNELSEKQKQVLIKEMVKCSVCRKYLSFAMVQPIKAPMDYRKINSILTPCTITGIPWEEFERSKKDIEEKDKKKRIDYYNKHKEHIMKHSKEIRKIVESLK